MGHAHGIFGQADGPNSCHFFEVHVPVKGSDSRHEFSVSWWRNTTTEYAVLVGAAAIMRSSLLRSGSAAVLGSSGPPSCLGTPPSHPTTQPDTPNVTKKPPSPAHACTPLTCAADPRTLNPARSPACMTCQGRPREARQGKPCGGQQLATSGKLRVTRRAIKCAESRNRTTAGKFY